MHSPNSLTIEITQTFRMFQYRTGRDHWTDHMELPKHTFKSVKTRRIYEIWISRNHICQIWFSYLKNHISNMIFCNMKSYFEIWFYKGMIMIISVITHPVLHNVLTWDQEAFFHVFLANLRKWSWLQVVRNVQHYTWRYLDW